MFIVCLEKNKPDYFSQELLILTYNCLDFVRYHEIVWYEMGNEQYVWNDVNVKINLIVFTNFF